MHKAAAYAALTRWQEYTIEVMRDRACLTKVMSRMMNLRLTASWQTWRGFMRVVYSIRADTHRLKLMSGMVRRMRGRTVLAVFSNWKLFAQKCLRANAVMLRLVKNIGLRQLSVAFRTWQWSTRSSVEGAHAAAARAALLEHAREKSVSRIVRQWKRTQLNAAFSGWRTHVSWAVSSRNQLRHCLAQWSKRQLLHAMVAWAAYSRNAVRARTLVDHRRVNTQLREQLERCATAMHSLLQSASATGRTVPEMAAAVADAERVASRTGPGLARQFDDCTANKTEFRALKPTAANVSGVSDELPITPVKSPPKEHEILASSHAQRDSVDVHTMRMQQRAASPPSRVELESQLAHLARRDERLATAVNQSPYRQKGPNRTLVGEREGAAAATAAAADGVGGHRTPSPDNHYARLSSSESAPMTPPASVGTIVGGGGGYDYSSSSSHGISPAVAPDDLETQQQRRRRLKKHEALHARLMKSGYYSAAAKVRPLYTSPTRNAAAPAAPVDWQNDLARELATVDM
jgi:hypothetical protein